MSSVSMSVQDALWLTMDRPNNLMVVDGAMVLTETPTPEGFRDVFARTVERFPVFARRPVRAGLGWGWEEDPTFNLDRHLEILEFSEPLDITGLQQFLADQRSVPLPKDRPLWRGYLLTPVRLDDGSLGAAMVTRFHHSIGDGVRLTQVILSMCATDNPEVAANVARGSHTHAEVGHDTVTEVAMHAANEATHVVAHGVGGVLSGAAHAVRHPLETVTDAPHLAASAARAGVHGIEGGISLIRHPDRLLDALEVLGVENNRGSNDLSSVTKLALADSEDTVWSGAPGVKKAVAWSKPIPLAAIKEFGKANHATVNDVLLAAVAGGLRRYLAERNTALDEVIWMVPVNLKPFEENLPPDLGNYFALVFVPMPLDQADPLDRLVQIHHRMERIKNSDEAVLTFGLQRVVSTSPGQIAFFLTNFFANKAVGVLTNVPGPKSLLRFAGAPVYQVIGFAPCSGNQPMTTTIFSYNGTVTVGFATDAGLVPNPGELADYVVADLAAMGIE